MLCKILLGTLISVNSYASVSYETVYNMFMRFKNIVPAHRVDLTILNSKTKNAFSTQHKLEITQGLLNDIRNLDELALVLGHEFGHIYQEDFRKSSSSYKQELSADALGVYFMTKLGYNRCNGSKLLFRLNKGGVDGIHPTNSYRYKQTTRGCH